MPERHGSAIHKEMKAKCIGATVIQANTIRDHETYQKYLNPIERHSVNLIIELPRLPENGDMMQRLRKHMSRAQKYASVADKVYVIAPANNDYWHDWESEFNDRNGYTNTFHDW